VKAGTVLAVVVLSSVITGMYVSARMVESSMTPAIIATR
jgi:hypothetical protein